jgi:hypothetical protein
LIKPTERVQWQRSSRCGTSACVEIAKVDDAVLMRDAKDPDGVALAFSAAGWAAFLVDVKAGVFDV